jgi:hypothetical protein
MNFKNIALALFGIQGVLGANDTDTESTNLRGSKIPSANPTMVPTFYTTHATANRKTVSPIDLNTGNKAVALIDHARRSTNPSAANMLHTYWDPALESELVNFAEHVDPNWFFERCDLTGPKRNSNSSFCGFNLMKMAPFNTKFPGYDFVIHDTFVRPQKLLFILNFRLNQAHCINYNKCNPNIFSNFESCGDPLVQVPSQTCSWATQYRPRMLIASLNKFACITFKAHGPNAPKAQGWSFFCYGNFTRSVNDVPYIKGASCSKCPDYAAECNQGLCIPKKLANG